jgi:hypothetical protein
VKLKKVREDISKQFKEELNKEKREEVRSLFIATHVVVLICVIRFWIANGKRRKRPRRTG